MARRLGTHLINEMSIQDKLSDSEIILYYRMPTTKERIGYTNASVKRQGSQVKMQLGQARQKWGGQILMGFRTGAFEKDVGGEFVLFASDKSDPLYDPEWKKLIQEYAPDVIEALASRVFDAPVEVLDAEDMAGEGEDEDEDKEDAEKN